MNRPSQALSVLILIEHYQREYVLAERTKQLISTAIPCSRVYIRHIYLDAHISLFPAIDIVFFPFFYSGSDSILHKYYLLLKKCNPSVLLVNLAWEQTNYPGNSSLKIPRDALAKTIPVHLLWTKRNADA